MKKVLLGLGILLVGCTPETSVVVDAPAAAPEAAQEAPVPAVMGTLPAGDYTLDKTHASLVFEVSHLAFSNYTAGFDRLDATLQIDPANPAAAKLSATVDLTSLDLPSPPDGFLTELLGPDWLNATEHSEATFLSTSVEPTGEASAHVTGDLTFNGQTAPVEMDVVFNGGWEGIPPDPAARIGFSAQGTLNRSEFGVSSGIPEEGSTMGVGDAVRFRIEAEFSGPPMDNPQ